MTAAIPRLSPPSTILFALPFILSLSLSARLPWALRVNHVRQADPLIKTGPPSLLIIIVIRGSECRALGESRLLRVYVPRIDTPTYIYVFAIPLHLLLIVRIFEIIKWLTRLRMNLVSYVP